MPGTGLTFEKVESTGIGKSMDSLLRQIGLARSTPGGRDEVEDPLSDSWVVYACVQALTEAVRQVPMSIWESTDEDAQEVGEEHPIRKLFEMPNPDMGLPDLLAAGMTHRKLSGEDWWFLMDSEGKPISPSVDARAPIPLPTVIVPVIGDIVEDARDQYTGRITAVQYAANGAVPPTFPVASTVHFYDYNPGDPMRGLSPLEAALRVISVGFQAERYQEAVMRGGGPGAFLNYEDGMSNEEEYRLQESVNEAVKDPDVVGGFKVVTGKVNIVPNPATPKDMMQRETLNWVRDTVCSILQVPPPVIGNYDTATYNNVTEAYRQFWQGVKGYLDSVAEKINSHLLSRLEDPRLAGCYISFDFSGITALQEDHSAKFKLAAELAAYGVGLSFNDSAKMLGLEVETVESANTVFTPMSNQVFAVNDTNTGEDTSVQPQTVVPAAPTAPTEEPATAAPAASAGLNGAQVESLLLIITQVAQGSLSQSSGAALINAAFPSISIAQANQILGGASATMQPVAEAAKSHASKRFDTREERIAFAESIYKKTLDAAERRLAADVLTWFRRYERAQKAKLREFAEAGPTAQKSITTKAWTERDVELYLLLNKEEWERQLDELISANITATWRDGLADTAELIGGVQLEVTDPRIVRMIAEQRAQIVEGVNSRLAAEIRDKMMVTLSSPTTTSEIASSINEVLPELDEDLASVFGSKESRALTIARTETGKAYNSAAFQEYESAGVTKIQWVSSNDATTRPSHLALDGEIRKPGEAFAPNLRFPNDPQGAPEETINCRCVLAPLD
jgi:HK97 family phage portal protein